jgi:hypothetical protein
MTSELSTPAIADPHQTVTSATQSFVHHRQLPDSQMLTAALLALERSAKQTRLVLPLESLLGTWRLCFSAGKKARYQSGQPIGNGFYVPRWVIAQISFTPEHPQQLAIANELRVGSLQIRFSGPARYQPKKNLLAFDFNYLTIRGGSISLYHGAFKRPKSKEMDFAATAIARLPFFAFFAATQDYIAARGRGGGLAVWVKQIDG